MKSFSPHLWLKVERDIPSQIFIVALVGVPELLRINLPNLVSLDTIEQMIRDHFAALRENKHGRKVVNCFGKVLGYYHHYEYGKCNEYDTNGKKTGHLGALPPHYGEVATLRIDGREVKSKSDITDQQHPRGYS
jgi:hypothetical protein